MQTICPVRSQKEVNQYSGSLSLSLLITSKDANPWGDSRGMRLLQGQGGARHVHSLRSSAGLFERTNVKRHTTNHRVRDQGPCYSYESEGCSPVSVVGLVITLLPTSIISRHGPKVEVA